MFTRLFVLCMGLAVVHVCDAHIVGGWQATGEGDSQTEMLALAREQLNASDDSSSAPIEVVSFETQIVAGTNLRLVFVVDGKQQCTMTAFKPLPYKKQPTKVKSFSCEDVTSNTNWVQSPLMLTSEYLFRIKNYFFWSKIMEQSQLSHHLSAFLLHQAPVIWKSREYKFLLHVSSMT